MRLSSWPFPHNVAPRGRRQRGVSLIELMIAITIALIILAAMSWIFVGNSRSRAEAERGSQQLENGSYAMQTLTSDLQMAGYWAEFNVGLAITSGQLLTPAALPNPCSTDPAVIAGAIPLAVQGYDQTASLSCISDRRANTDVLVVRRASGCVAGSLGCAPLAGGGKVYFQASTCDDDNELENVNAPAAANLANAFRLDTAAANLNRHKKNCLPTGPGTLADQHEVLTHIYFVANNDVAGDGIPTLKRAELDPPDAAAVNGFKTVSIAQGVENMQVEYGIDTSATPDRVPDVFESDPINACATPPCVSRFQNAMAVNVYLLVRNPTKTTGYVDAKTYTLGSYTVPAPSSADLAYKRHVYTGAVRLINPSIR